MSLRMLLASTHSIEYFDNKPDFFRIQLSKQIQLDGYWMVGLTEFTTQSWIPSRKQSEIYVCCDICQEMFIGGKEISLLRRVFLSDKKEDNFIYTNPYYIPLKTRNYSSNQYIFNG